MLHQRISSDACTEYFFGSLPRRLTGISQTLSLPLSSLSNIRAQKRGERRKKDPYKCAPHMAKWGWMGRRGWGCRNARRERENEFAITECCMS